jgi:limonene-1,2-epoxide hydrolase
MTSAYLASRRSALAGIGTGVATLAASGQNVGLASEASAATAGTTPVPADAVRQMDPNPAQAANIALALKIQELTGGPEPRFADTFQYFAEDIALEIGKDTRVAGRAAVMAYLPTFYQNGLRYSFDIFATQASGPIVTFSRIDRISRPGVADRSIAVVAVFMFRKGLLRRWYELPAYLDN